jgi:DedD protein
MAQAVPPGSDEQHLKQRALRRLAVALGLIAAAIIGLALLDRYTSLPKRPAEKPGSEPPPIAALPEPKPVQPAPEAATPPAPAPQATPALPPPPPPVVSNEPLAPPVEAKRVPPLKDGQAVPESSKGAVKTTPKAEPKGPAAALKPSPDATPAAAPAPEPIKGFVVQTGVFTSTQNAQALEAKLREQGIPVFTETRVVAGPFHTRGEADAARKKLKAMGLRGLVAKRR